MPRPRNDPEADPDTKTAARERKHGYGGAGGDADTSKNSGPDATNPGARTGEVAHRESAFVDDRR